MASLLRRLRWALFVVALLSAVVVLDAKVKRGGKVKGKKMKKKGKVLTCTRMMTAFDSGYKEILDAKPPERGTNPHMPPPTQVDPRTLAVSGQELLDKGCVQHDQLSVHHGQVGHLHMLAVDWYTTLADSNLAVDRARPHYERATDAAEDADGLALLAAEYGGALVEWGRKVSMSHDKVSGRPILAEAVRWLRRTSPKDVSAQGLLADALGTLARHADATRIHARLADKVDVANHTATATNGINAFAGIGAMDSYATVLMQTDKTRAMCDIGEKMAAYCDIEPDEDTVEDIGIPVFKAVTDCMIRAERLTAACNARRGRFPAAYTAMVKARRLMLKCLVAVEGRDDGSALGVCGPVCWAEETSIRLADRVNRDAEETAIIVKPKSRMVKLDSETAADTASTGSGAAGDGGDGEGGVGGGCAADGDWFPNTKAQDRGLAALGLGGWRDRANANMVAFLSETDLEARAPEAFHVTYIAGNRPAMVTEPAALEGRAAVSTWGSAAALLEAYGEVEFVVSANPDPGTHGSVSTTMSLQSFADIVLRQTDPDAGDAGDGAGTHPPTDPDMRSIFGLLKRGNPMAADLVKAKIDKKKKTNTQQSKKKNENENIKKKKKKKKGKGKDKGRSGGGGEPVPELPRYEPGSPMVPPLPADQRPRPQLFFGPALGGAMPRDHGASWNLLIRGRRRWFLFPAHCRNWGYTDMWGKSAAEWAAQSLPKLRGRPCSPVEVEQTGGQVLLIPFGWGHAVLNLEASIGAMKQLEMVNMTHWAHALPALPDDTGVAYSGSF